MESKLSRVIQGYTHQDYKHVIAKAKLYRQIVTGEDYGDLVISYRLRESEAQKIQRIHITHVRTKSVAGKIDGFIDRVFRADKLKFEVSHESETERSKISQQIDSFGNDGNSLLIWSEEIAHYYNDIDPNAFYWLKHEVKNQKDEFTPIIFSSEQVKDFNVKKGVVDYCVAEMNESVTYTIDKENKKSNVCFYYYFSDTIEQVAIYIDGDLAKNSNYYEAFINAENVTQETIYNKTYIVITKQNEIGKTPVARIGYNLDKETNMRTYVSFWDKATELYKMLINDGSALDITKALHIFAQKFVYYTDCNYQDALTNAICKGGKMHPNKSTCPSCKGSGKQHHITAQDIIEIRMPNEGETLAISPKDMAFYLETPMDIVEFEQKLVDSYEAQISECIYGVDLSHPKSGAATATEINSYYENAQDALYKFTKAPRKIFLFSVDTIAKYLQVDGLTAYLEYPSEYSLESESDLILMLEKATLANAAPEIIENITKRIALKQNPNNRTLIDVWAAMRKFMPFGGIGGDLKQSVILERPASDLQRNLALNFKEITEYILYNVPNFMLLDYKAQKAIVDTQTKVFANTALEAERVKSIAEMAKIDNQGG